VNLLDNLLPLGIQDGQQIERCWQGLAFYCCWQRLGLCFFGFPARFFRILELRWLSLPQGRLSDDLATGLVDGHTRLPRNETTRKRFISRREFINMLATRATTSDKHDHLCKVTGKGGQVLWKWVYANDAVRHPRRSLLYPA
jgi:hypothetical protein